MGKRTEADVLHLRFNKSLHCLSWNHVDARRGTFTKDLAGSASTKGLHYRRFVCHRQHGCGAIIGIKDFIQLCQNQSLIIAASGIINLIFVFTSLLFLFFMVIYPLLLTFFYDLTIQKPHITRSQYLLIS